MNRLTIIGNLTRDPELRTTQSGKNVCTFTLAVNRRGQNDQTDYFRVSAWEKLGDNCHRYLAKGRKAAGVGPVSVSTYTANDGTTRANMEVMANEVEFLSAANADVPATKAPAAPSASADNNGFVPVDDDDLPW